jgi:hypothetical protein
LSSRPSGVNHVAGIRGRASRGPAVEVRILPPDQDLLGLIDRGRCDRLRPILHQHLDELSRQRVDEPGLPLGQMVCTIHRFGEEDLPSLRRVLSVQLSHLIARDEPADVGQARRDGQRVVVRGVVRAGRVKESGHGRSFRSAAVGCQPILPGACRGGARPRSPMSLNRGTPELDLTVSGACSIPRAAGMAEDSLARAVAQILARHPRPAGRRADGAAGRYDEAAVILAAGEHSLAETTDRCVRAQLVMDHGAVLLRAGRLEEAGRRLAEAAQLAEGACPQVTSHVLTNLAFVRHEAGAAAEAKALLAQARAERRGPDAISGTSLDAQKTEIERYCTAQGWPTPMDFVEMESGGEESEAKRREAMRLLAVGRS